MGSLFRSESMSLCQLFVQSEAAYNSIAELGEEGLVQFRDLNPDVNAFQRKFIHEVRRCDEMERMLRFVEREIKKDGIPVNELLDGNLEAPAPREMIELESTFEKLENELKEVIASRDELKKTFLDLTQLKCILQRAQIFFNQDGISNPAFDEGNLIPVSESLRPGALQLNFVAGIISRERLGMFERMLWRVCRGNVYMKTAEIETPFEDTIYPEEKVFKSVFVIFIQGDQLKTRVRKICEGCRATLYPCPDTSEERREMVIGVSSRIEDLSTVIRQTSEHRHRILVASSRNLRTWFTKVRKIKAIYCTLNCFNFDVTQKCLIGECWCPEVDMDRIQNALSRGANKSGSTVPSILNRLETSESPPTFNRTNKVTSGFQNIVDAYGVANYLEVNPSPFTIITFPFLFAVMFGDAGHGLIMALFALYLVWKEEKIIGLKSKNEIFLTFFNGRYIILLMGFFSMYTGFLYNDVFAKSLNIFGSRWFTNSATLPDGAKNYILDPATHYKGDPYWFGIDPIWQTSGNKILFLNSYKMKLSVILGVAQMLFGTVLSFFNHIYFRKPVNVFCEFIPQVIFLMSIFGYMNLLIIAKWIIFDSESSGSAPSILITLINMFMQKYEDPNDPKVPENLKPMYAGQKTVQTILVLLAIVCIPWMLVIKPWILKKENDRKVRFADMVPTFVSSSSRLEEGIAGGRRDEVGEESTERRNGSLSISQHLKVDSSQEDHRGAAVILRVEESEKGEGKNHHDDGKEEEGEGGSHGGKFELGDVIIHQAIHTIEYCLGSISHTASYLRLWALSLAHAQLSEVLWNMVMRIGLTIGSGTIVGGVVMYVIFAFWASLTIGVLLLMEGLSAFLHALRLHWVEFQSKFYSGAGYIFLPFDFKRILEEAAADD